VKATTIGIRTLADYSVGLKDCQQACQAGKQVGAPHHAKNIMTTTRPLEMLHMDLFGPIAYISIGGNKYGLVIIDDYSRFTWVFFLHDNCETKRCSRSSLRWHKMSLMPKLRR
jgi:hypothetical protein